ncbi:hypothetical protein CEP54_011993 [Fusarium duplospermum]|uniref:Uncharacterized protein n=1 Tax=Fusarium duplospermum TaxID=1325734 RepID=A0A428PBJ4_9HYPO|nr:hypothetical protein CEP54_011993 [Fusarium duplospermum]
MSTLWSVPCNDLSDVKPYMALTTVFTPPSYCSTYFTDENNWAGADEGTSGAVVSYAKQNEDDPVWYSCGCALMGGQPWGSDLKKVPPQRVVVLALMNADFGPLGTYSGFVLNTSGDVCVKETTDFAVVRRPNPIQETTTEVSVVSWDDSTAWVTVSDELTSTVLDDSPLDPDSSLIMTITPVTTTETVTMNNGTLSHSAWVIMWQSSDRTSTSATSATSTASTTSTPVGPTEQPETNDDDNDTSLSGGAIAGIVVGVVAALVLGVMTGLLIQRRRQRPVEAPGAHEQPIFVQQGNPGGGYRPEQSPNGPVAPGMAYAVEGGTGVGSGHMQSKE